MGRFELIPAFRLVGNLYFVGSYEQSCHLIKTEDGLIMIDVGSEDNIPHVLEGFAALGFDVRDVRYILLSHWHWDHADGVPALRALTDAKVLIGARDEPFLHFPVDGVLQDGDKITLGGVTVCCVASAGHTAGTMSFFFDTVENGSVYRCGMFGGAGYRQLSKAYLDAHGVPYFLRGEFFETLDRLQQERVDVLVGNHSWHNQTRENRARMTEGEPNPFIDPTAWGRFIDHTRQKMWQLIEGESRDGFTVYAHRGASEYCPENTMLSFFTGVYMGAQGIETDVHRTKDGVLVLFHDDTIERMMHRAGSVGDYTLEELSGFVMEKCGRRDYIVTLDAFLLAFGRMELTLAIELKDRDIEQDVAEAIARFGLAEKVVITSFHFEYLVNMHAIAPQLKLGYLAKRNAIDDELLERMKQHGIDELCPYSRDILPENTKYWHGRGFRVRAWGVSNEDDMRRVYDNGADGTTVNFPDKLLAYIEQKKA